jgi:hypothetical protein
MSNIPTEITNNIILNYLTIYDNKYINKYIEHHRNLKIYNAMVLIRRSFYNYYIDYQNAITNNEYYIPKIHYKRFFPMYLRYKYILEIIEYDGHINIERYHQIMELYILYKSKKKSLITTFNQIIDILSYDELLFLGW